MKTKELTHEQQCWLQQAGHTAYRLGATALRCPFKGRDPRAVAWLTGFAEAKRLRVAKFPQASFRHGTAGNRQARNRWNGYNPAQYWNGIKRKMGR